MALADPLSLTIGGSAKSLPRVSITGEQTTYRLRSDDGSFYEVAVIHNTGKRYRHVVRFVRGVVTEDPITESNVLSTNTVTVTVDAPPTGISLADQVANAAGLMAMLTASTNAQLTKIVAGES